MNRAKKLIQIIEQGVETIPEMSMRKSTYRDKPGFTVTLGGPSVWGPSHIFFTQEDQAREFIRRVKAGENRETVLNDIWGIGKKKGEIFRGVQLQLGTSKFN